MLQGMLRSLHRNLSHPIFVTNQSLAMKTISTIGEIVTADYRAAGVLETFGIDFCNTGDKTLFEVCEEKHLDKDLLEKSLKELSASPGHQDPHWNYAEWDTRFLIDFIIHAHHKYIRETIPEIIRRGEKVAREQGLGRILIHEIHRLSQMLTDEITTHLDMEEQVIFPYILDLECALNENVPFVAPEFGRVESPIRKIECQHAQAVNILQEIRRLTNQYRLPAKTSAGQSAWYALLKEFDADMHLHIHLEKNILFPRAMALEEKLLERKGYTTIWFG